MNYDMSIHTNPDATAWADFFMAVKNVEKWKIEDIDRDLMVAWFSNAMMAMHDHMRPDLAPKVMPDGSAFFGELYR